MTWSLVKGFGISGWKVLCLQLTFDILHVPFAILSYTIHFSGKTKAKAEKQANHGQVKFQNNSIEIESKSKPNDQKRERFTLEVRFA